MVTIKEVAKFAGVSVASVSRYMNKKGYVSQETGEKIAHAIKELNYVPNEVARSLFQKTSKIVGVLLPDIANPYFPEVAKGIEETLNKNGLLMILANTSDSTELLNNYLTAFIQNNVIGIITALPLPVVPSKIHMIGIDRVYQGDFTKVLSDDYKGGQLVAKEILATTYQHILVVSSNLTVESSKKRHQGLTETFEAAGVAFTHLELDTYNHEKMKEIVAFIFEEYKNIDTLVAANDYLALNIMKEAEKRQIKIPEELQIIGYDGITFAQIANPSLTTIKQQAYNIGKLAAKEMLKSIESKEESLKSKTLRVDVEVQKGKTLRER